MIRRGGGDGLACGYYASTDNVSNLHLNSLWDERTKWGWIAPSAGELEARKAYITSRDSKLVNPSPAIIRRLRAAPAPPLEEIPASPPRTPRTSVHDPQTPIKKPRSPTKAEILAIVRSYQPASDILPEAGPATVTAALQQPGSHQRPPRSPGAHHTKKPYDRRSADIGERREHSRFAGSAQGSRMPGVHVKAESMEQSVSKAGNQSRPGASRGAKGPSV
ncbi:hypothetical protein PENSPDRAFT_694839 [Peniophora sp. CONT]|nr:hypothetical protein PENSPDRAFT_694839 [Peniophora sp. CONT]